MFKRFHTLHNAQHHFSARKLYRAHCLRLLHGNVPKFGIIGLRLLTHQQKGACAIRLVCHREFHNGKRIRAGIVRQNRNAPVWDHAQLAAIAAHGGGAQRNRFNRSRNARSRHIIAHGKLILKQQHQPGGNVLDNALCADAHRKAADASSRQHGIHCPSIAKLAHGDRNGNEIRSVFHNARHQRDCRRKPAGLHFFQVAGTPRHDGTRRSCHDSYDQPGQSKCDCNIDDRRYK